MFVCFRFLCFFFFQAEDGIRDLVRSRGLGDVYKRQVLARHQFLLVRTVLHDRVVINLLARFAHTLNADLDIKPVSYTHLTLPTSDLV